MQLDAFSAYWPANRQIAAAIMLLSSLVAVCYNLAHSLMIKHISAVATTVVGEFKILALIVLSAFLLGGWCEWGGLEGKKRFVGW